MFYYSLRLALGQSVDEEIKRNWNITQFKDWKKSEQVIITQPNKAEGVSLNCNKRVSHTPNTISLGVYTDIDTQLTLAQLKESNWFQTGYGTDWMLNKYLEIKDPSWPAVTANKEFLTLPDVIKTELVDVFNFDLDSIESEANGQKPNRLTSPAASNDEVAKSVRSQSTDYNGTVVTRFTKHIIDNADNSFLLQDIVQSKFKCVTDELGLNHTQKVIDHVDMWVKLHPAHIQEMLYAV